MINEILNAIWQYIQPMIGEIIVVVISIILTKIGLPKLFNKGLGFLFSYIPYKPVEAMAWGLVRHLAEKYKDDLPGQAKADRIFKEIKEHYAWFPDKKLMAIIKTQYRAWQGQLVEEKKRTTLPKTI